LFFIILTSDLLNNQPYYNIHVNSFRAGMWTMLTTLSLGNLIVILTGIKKSFIGIIIFAFSCLSFFIGIILNKYKFKKHIEAIYMRFRIKKIEDKHIENREKGINSSLESSEPDEEVSKSSESDNDSESDGNGDLENRDLIKIDSSSESNESDEDNENENRPDGSNSLIVSDRISEKITSFSSIREISKIYIIFSSFLFLYLLIMLYIYIYILMFLVKRTVSNEIAVIYTNIHEFELACRFIK